MPIEIWKSGKGRSWYWTAFAKNQEVVADSAEGYTSKAKAEAGAVVAAKELSKWLEEKSGKAKVKSLKPKSQITARQKQGGKRSSSSSNRTRKTGPQSASALKTISNGT
jgi:uncharacterized protein YegP (UPF0339 family)